MRALLGSGPCGRERFAEMDLVAEDARVHRLLGWRCAVGDLALRLRERVNALAPARDGDGADDGDHEERARELERHQRIGEEDAADRVDAAERGRRPRMGIRAAPAPARATAVSAEAGEGEETTAEDRAPAGRGGPTEPRTSGRAA